MSHVRSLLVLGGGSAGFLAAITCRAKFPQMPVVVLRSPEIGIIGVGEGSTPTLPQHLHGYIGVDLKRFYAEAEPTWKLGIRFLWGPRPEFHYPFRTQCDMRYANLSRETGFYYGDDFQDGEVTPSLMRLDKAFLRQANGAPLIDLNAAYHLENEKFVAFLESYALELGVKIVDGTVQQVEQTDTGIAGLRLASGETLAADLYVDCSGFRSLLLGAALAEPFRSFAPTLYCDQAVLGSWQRGADETIKPYTIAETMDAGWCWQIEHEHHVTRGYVHSSAFISADEAERELRAKNPRLGETRLVKFRTGRYERAWVKNVVAIGNAAGFVEPLEATSLGAICSDCQALAEILRDDGGRVTPAHVYGYNLRSARAWDTIRQFLAIHYKFNTRVATPFWHACQQDVDLAGAEPIVEFYQQNGPSTLWRSVLIDPIDQFRYDGYLTLLLGQKVPYATDFTPTPAERDLWKQIQAANRSRAAQGMTIAEALAMVRLPEWQWDPNFYRQVYTTPLPP